MIIDTDKATDWIKKHSRISVPAATGILSWYAATRWQAAMDHHLDGLMMFYFGVSAASGIVTIVLVVCHLLKLGFFESEFKG